MTILKPLGYLLLGAGLAAGVWAHRSSAAALVSVPCLALGLVVIVFARRASLGPADIAIPSRAVLTIGLGSRVAVLLAGALAVQWVGIEAAPGRFRVARNEVLNLPARWDAGWYLQIARHGYTWEPGGTARRQRIAFFPAFPLLMRAAAQVVTVPARMLRRPDFLGGGDARYLWGGVLVAAAAFLAGLFYVFRLARLDLTESQSLWAVTLTAAYPFAVFYSAPYTEGLFLLAAAGSLYHFRLHQFGTAAFFGLLAGLTRPNGFLLAGALGVLLLSSRPWIADRRAAVLGGLTAASPLFGAAAFSLFVWRLTGRPFAWAQAQEGWGRSASVFGFVARRVADVQELGWDYVRALPTEALSSAAIILALLSIPLMARRLPVAYATLTALYLAPPLLIDLPGIGRMTSVLFPVFIWLAASSSPPVLRSTAVIFGALQLAGAAIFFTWGPLT